MSRKVWKKEQLPVAQYANRCDNREVAMMTATMNLVAYFVLNDISGDDDATKKANAEDKVGQLAIEVKECLYLYRFGKVHPLIDAVNASALPFMDADAKAFIISDLTV